MSEKSIAPVPPNTVLVGKKPLMSYVTAILMQLSSGGKEITVKARGRAISRAVDVVEVVSNKFYPNKVKIRDVRIGTDIIGTDPNKRNVSTIEITIEKKE
jgi:DNA-binding protein